MPQQLSHENRLLVVRLLLNNWRAKDIARQIGCNVSTIYNLKENLLKYGQVSKPQLKTIGRPSKVPEFAREAAEAFLREHPEAQQKDVRLFLSRECNVEVHQSSVSRLVRKDGQNGNKGVMSGASPSKNRPQAAQSSPGRPLCGDPHCSQYASAHPSPVQPAPNQPPPDLAAAGQIQSGQHLPSHFPPTPSLVPNPHAVPRSTTQHPSPPTTSDQPSPSQHPLR